MASGKHLGDAGTSRTVAGDNNGGGPAHAPTPAPGPISQQMGVTGKTTGMIALGRPGTGYSCIPLGDGDFNVGPIIGVMGDNTTSYSLQIAWNGTYNGPGSYGVSTTYTTVLVGSRGYIGSSGTIVVNADQRTGSIDVDLFHDGDKTNLQHIRGTWRCP